MKVAAKRGLFMSLPAVSIITFMAFPSVSSVAFRAWACVEFDLDTKYDIYNQPLQRAAPDVESFMRDDLKIKCGSPEHDDAVGLASLAIVLYPVGIPLLYLLLLISARKAIKKERPTPLSSALSFLHRDFEARMYGWEIAEQFKKLFLVGIMVRIQNDTIVQLGVAMVFTMIFMLVASIAAPFRKQENDYFAVTCNFLLTAVFLFCIMLKVKTVAETLDPGELYNRLFFDEFLIGGCLLVCIVGALFLACALSVQTIIQAARVPAFRLLSTGNRPELALAKGHKWHIFLSHIWGTGQDQCAVLKRQLCLLLTGVSVFLDVDDLEDIGALEEYIEKSAVVMIFVSKGYFKSGNCLREARCAMEKGKPLSLMHDPVRGGAPLKSIVEEECPAEMRGPLFSSSTAREVITFHRIKDFQLVTMKLLGQDVQLMLPGEVTRKRLRFEGGPISVYVSLHNPGGALAMRALQEGFHEARAARKGSRRLSLVSGSSCTKASAATLPGGAPASAA